MVSFRKSWILDGLQSLRYLLWSPCWRLQLFCNHCGLNLEVATLQVRLFGLKIEQNHLQFFLSSRLQFSSYFNPPHPFQIIQLRLFRPSKHFCSPCTSWLNQVSNEWVGTQKEDQTWLGLQFSLQACLFWGSKTNQQEQHFYLKRLCFSCFDLPNCWMLNCLRKDLTLGMLIRYKGNSSCCWCWSLAWQQSCY